MYHVTLCWTILVTPPVRTVSSNSQGDDCWAGKRATLRQQYTICSNSILLDHKMTGPGWFEMISLSTCPLPVSRSASRSSCYDCQPPILHIKNPSPCLRDFSSLTRQQSITIISSAHTLFITVFSSWKLLQFLRPLSLSHCLPSGVPLRSSYVLRSIYLVRSSPSLCPWSCRLICCPSE